MGDDLDLSGGNSFGFDLTIGDPDLSLGWLTDSNDNPYLDPSWLGSLGSVADISNLDLGGFKLSDIWSGVKNLIGAGSGGASKAADFAGTMGLAALANKLLGGDKGPTGYQGGIPTYTAERQQLQAPAYTPYAQFTPGSTAYRPGQGGINYFAPVKYTEQAPATATPAPADTTTPATGGTADTTAPVQTTEPLKDDGTPRAYAHGGGITMLAAGGRYIKGPGDGVSDSVPATIHSAQGGQPAALADGEFVIPARVVAEIGNGSNEAGARKLYAMMDRVEQMAKKAKRGKPSGADKELNKLV